MAAVSESPTKVLVTGAGGRTGKLAIQKLLSQPDKFTAAGLVHSDRSAQAVQQDTGLAADATFVADITEDSEGVLSKALEGVHALIIATSAVPKMDADQKPGAPPSMSFPQMPEQVDWLGQKQQIDAAVKAGVSKIVLISSMGGTNPENRLNSIGGGNILLWKRKTEVYLTQQKGIDYFILHPGGLTDEPGGESEVLIGVDDELQNTEFRRIPRADVAELSVQAILLPEASNRSIDAVAKPPPGSTDYKALLSSMTKNCDYSLGKTG